MEERVKRELRIARKLIMWVKEDISKDINGISKTANESLLKRYQYAEEILIRILTGD